MATNRTREASRLVSKNNLYVTSSDNIGVGTTVASTKLQVAGNVTAIDFNSTSDIRKKENITDLTNALDIVGQLRGVSFNWVEDQTPSIGVIAQELQEVLPELVHGDDTLTVNYNGIIGVLIEAVKELKAEVAELKQS
tara:strand:- start:912 stop:1325 length:414 start_codon:yes stop_codon:yes gene_type:complete